MILYKDLFLIDGYSQFDNVRVTTNLLVDGYETILDTETRISEQVFVTNMGTGPALNVEQIGTADVAVFKDDGTSVLTIKNGGNVAFNTLTGDKALYLDPSNNIKSSIVTQQELEYLTGATSNIQGQIDSLSSSTTNLSDGYIWIGNDNNNPIERQVSGDVVLDSYGTTTLTLGLQGVFDNAPTAFPDINYGSSGFEIIGTGGLDIQADGYFQVETSGSADFVSNGGPQVLLASQTAISSRVRLLNDASINTDAISLEALSGGITATAASDITLSGTGNLDFTGNIFQVTATGSFANSIDVNSAGGIDIDANDGIAIDVGATSNLTTTAGSINISNNSTTPGDNISISSASPDSDALTLVTPPGSGGILLDAYQGVAIDARQNINFSTNFGEIQLDGGLINIGDGTYTVANGINDLGVSGSFEVIGDGYIRGEVQLVLDGPEDGYIIQTDGSGVLSFVDPLEATPVTLQRAFDNSHAEGAQPDILIENTEDFDIHLADSARFLITDSSDSSPTVEITREHFQIFGEHSDSPTLTVNTIDGDGYVHIDGYLSVTGSTFEVDTQVTDADHWLITPDTNIDALRILPESSAYSGNMINVHLPDSDGYAFQVQATGDGYFSQNVQILGQLDLDGSLDADVTTWDISASGTIDIVTTNSSSDITMSAQGGTSSNPSNLVLETTASQGGHVDIRAGSVPSFPSHNDFSTELFLGANDLIQVRSENNRIELNAGSTFDNAIIVDSAGGVDVNTAGPITLDGGLVNIGSGAYSLADGTADLGVGGDLEVSGQTRLNSAVDINANVDIDTSGSTVGITIDTDTGRNIDMYHGGTTGSAVFLKSEAQGVDSTADAGFHIETNGTNAAPPMFLEASGQTESAVLLMRHGGAGNTLGLDVPNGNEGALTESWTLTFPAASPSLAGQVLADTDGAGTLKWERSRYVTTQQNSNYLAIHFDRVLADTSGGSFTVDLPATPSTGDVVMIMDGAGSFGTNPLTVGRNGENIQGAASDFTINTNNAWAEFVYNNASRGWEVRT